MSRPSPRRPAHPEEPVGRPILVSLSPTPSSSSNGKCRTSDPRLRRAEQSTKPATARSRSKIRSSRSHHPAASDRVAATESRRRQSPRRRSRSRRQRHSELRKTRDIQRRGREVTRLEPRPPFIHFNRRSRCGSSDEPRRGVSNLVLINLTLDAAAATISAQLYYVL